MDFKANKIILFCNRRLTAQISQNWNDSGYLQNLLNCVKVQSKNKDLADIDLKNIIDYILYTLGNYYRGNIVFTFQILVAFLYLITPVDIVNDFIPVIGYLDDILLLNLIISMYKEELSNFNKIKKESLDIEFFKVSQKVIDGFDMEPNIAMELLIKDKDNEQIDGTQILKEQLEVLKSPKIEDFLDIDVIKIMKYELINYLQKSKNECEDIDEELIESLIQIPNIVGKKDINYFLKNIEEIMSQFEVEVRPLKKGLFKSSGINLKFDSSNLTTTPQINFLQTGSSYTKTQLVIKYESDLKDKIDYELLVEMMDLTKQNYLFDETIIYFEINLNDESINFKVDKSLQEVDFIASIKASSVLNEQLAVIADLIKERMI